MQRLIAIAMFASAVGCGVRYPDPLVTGVVPSRGWNGADTVVVIEGENLYPEVHVDTRKDGDATVEGFTAWLVDPKGGDDVDIGGRVRDFDRLVDVVVPAGLTPGVYDVRVDGPNGRSAGLSGAFTVSDTLADGLAVMPEAPSAVVNSAIAVEIHLEDPNGDRVEEAGFGVALSVLDENDAPFLGAVFETGDLIAPQFVSGGVTGILPTKGAVVGILSDTPGIYTVVASPQRDDGVRQGSAVVEWSAGLDRTLEITLPSTPFSAIAGVPFTVELQWLDEFGNPIPGADTALLESDCSGFLAEVLVTGKTVHEVTLNRACPADQLSNARDPSSGSATFEVTAADVDHFAVNVLPVSPVAGNVASVQVLARDAFSNAVDWSGTVGLSASTGGLIPGTCAPHPFNPGENDCTATLTVAASGVVIHALGDDGTEGDSAPFTVLPGVTVSRVAASVDTDATAGTPVVARLELLDPWDNTIDASGYVANDFDLVDDLGEAACAHTGADFAGLATFSCVLYTARPDATLHVDLLALGLGDDSDPFAVINGPIASADVVFVAPDPAFPDRVVAGTPFPLTITGRDDWGNVTETIADPTLDLVDGSGTLSPTQATLVGTGSVEVQAILERAGVTAVEVWQAGVRLGTSTPIDVVPGPSSALAVDIADPAWAWVGVPMEVQVTSVDAWGNPTDWTGTATLSSRLTGTAPLGVPVDGGVGTAQFIWSGPAIDEVLDASEPGGFAGESAPLDVVSDCGAGGPTAAVEFGGFPEPIACLDPLSGVAPFTASFAASTPGPAPLTRYDVAVEGGDVFRSSSSTVNADLPGAGVFPLRGLIVDSAGCASEVAETGYAGADDGNPVGPIALSAGAAAITAGVGSTSIDVIGATDCARDVAAGGTVLLWTRLGDLVGATPSGSGLSLVLDAAGDGQVTLSAAAVDSGGDATVTAWNGGGGALGQVVVDVTGDDLRPTVWWQDPAGDTVGSWPDLVVRFSEPIAVPTAIPANFTVSGPAAVTVDGVTLDGSGIEATIAVTPDIDATLGLWTLTVSQSVRDVAGNRLSGDWSGVATSYAGPFGVAPAAVDAVICTGVIPATAVFRPDGDDGAGEEADEITVELSSATSPAWWEATVRDPAGTEIRVDRAIPAGAEDAWTWDGRDGAGRVVDDGVWTLEITPIDALENRGTGCAVAVRTEHAAGGGP